MIVKLVLSEVGLLAARHRALVRFHFCVSPHVVISVTDHRKSHVAHLAAVRFMSRMGSFVHLNYDEK